MMVQRRRWTAMAALGLALGAAVGTTVPAGAANPGPTQLPALSVSVQNYCTGGKVKHLSVSAQLPGGPVLSPTTTKTGHFVYQTLSEGTYLVSVAGPGYEALSDGTDPGVEVTINPGPTQMPAGTTITPGVTGVVQLLPTAGSGCMGPGPIQVNALTGIVDNAATGAKVKHLSASHHQRRYRLRGQPRPDQQVRYVHPGRPASRHLGPGSVRPWLQRVQRC